jgi:hypothetical protein
MIQSCGWVIIDGLVYLTKADASLFFFLPGMWHISCVFFHQVVKKNDFTIRVVIGGGLERFGNR